MNFTTGFIFQLIDKYQIPLEPERSFELEGDTYKQFCDEYIALSGIRDSFLRQHLINKPNQFRTFLPWRESIFSTVFQLQWYYDEIIIYDPIFIEITQFTEKDIQSNKFHLCRLLLFLSSIKESICNGFLLFGSYETFSANRRDFDQSKFENLLSIPEIRQECDQLGQGF